MKEQVWWQNDGSLFTGILIAIAPVINGNGLKVATELTGVIKLDSGSIITKPISELVTKEPPIISKKK
jgi:hypothetical protein